MQPGVTLADGGDAQRTAIDRVRDGGDDQLGDDGPGGDALRHAKDILPHPQTLGWVGRRDNATMLAQLGHAATAVVALDLNKPIPWERITESGEVAYERCDCDSLNHLHGVGSITRDYSGR